MMGAQKAREILAVESYTNQEGLVRCKVTVRDPFGREAIVRLADLSRGELMRAASIAFPESGIAWVKVPMSITQTAIRAQSLDSVREYLASGHVIIETNPQAQREYNQKLEALNPPADKAQQLAKLLAEMGAGGVDTDKLYRDVRVMVKEAVAEIPPAKVELVKPDGSSKVLPDQHHAILPDVIQALHAGTHVLLVGPAGSGKSTIAFQAAESLSQPCQSFSFDPQTPKSQLFGFIDANGRSIRTPLREAYEHGHLALMDELDNGNPGSVAGLNQMLSNGHAAFADGIVAKHPAFRCVATGNTFGRGGDRKYVGRNALDMATLDRFVIMETPYDEKLERSLALGHAGDDDSLRQRIGQWVDRVQSVRRNVEALKLNVIVSPRASIDGAKLLASGMPEHKVAEIRLFPGMPADVRRQVDK